MHNEQIAMKIGFDEDLKIKFTTKKEELNSFSTTKSCFTLYQNYLSISKFEMEEVEKNTLLFFVDKTFLKPRSHLVFIFKNWNPNLQKSCFNGLLSFRILFETKMDGAGWTKETHLCYCKQTRSFIHNFLNVYRVSRKNNKLLGSLPKPIFFKICFFLTK